MGRYCRSYLLRSPRAHHHDANPALAPLFDRDHAELNISGGHAEVANA